MPSAPTELWRQSSRSRADNAGTSRAGAGALVDELVRVVDDPLVVDGAGANSDHRKTVGNWAIGSPNW
jgi:hypothetical protein